MAISRLACEQNAKTTGGERVTIKGDVNWLNHGASFSGLRVASSPRQSVSAVVCVTDKMCFCIHCGFQSRRRLISGTTLKVLILGARNE
jgi:hypothetical protein